MSRGNLNANKNLLVCFVCDQKVAGDRVNLATSLAPHSKVTLPEKISQLVGDDYVVAITETDCVCKRCHSLLNHMDKLEYELTLVKRALTTNISQKYKINFDNTPAPVAQPPLSNGLKTDSASDYEEEPRKINNTDVTAANATQLKKKVTPPTKVAPTPKPTKPAENVTKLKIYKCGFCSYQSKELGNVRLHMKIHIRANKSDADGDKTAAVASSPLVTPKPSVPVRRRVFRCQVCSASFDDRNKCLEHISRDHTAAGRKLVEQKQNQAEQQQQQQSQQTTAVADTPSDSTSRVEVSSAEQPTATPETTTATAETSTNDETTTQEGLNNQEEMDTSDPPSIALYECDSCPSNFNNDVEFANHANDHTETKDEEMPTTDAKETTEESEQTKAEDSEFTEIPSQTDAQTTNEDDAPKDAANFGMDIEAMIAALHSEGPEANTDSMPNI